MRPDDSPADESPRQEAPTGFKSCLSCAGSTIFFLLALYSSAFLGVIGLLLLLLATIIASFAIAQLFTK